VTYFPSADDWHYVAPAHAGFDAGKLQAAVTFARQAESQWPTELSKGLGVDAASGKEPPPYDEVLGPTLDRGGANGVLTRGGRIVASWGDSKAREMTFSVAKSYLAVLAGIAVGEGLIRSIDEPVRNYVDDGGFDSPQNRAISWRHLLHQSSEWEGTLFDKPDWLDRNRQVGTGKDNSRKGEHRDLCEPGTFYEYNDIRVNRLSLSLLRIFKRPLPDVLREKVMRPIGASEDWQWLPYRNSWVEVEGELMPCVPGGSHWGGGIFIGSEDHARFGLLVARDGLWNNQRLLPEGWVDFLRTPSPCFASYGGLWWLNHDLSQYPSAPRSSFFAMGAGSHLIWVDQKLDLVAVLRWLDKSKADDIIAGFMRALTD